MRVYLLVFKKKQWMNKQNTKKKNYLQGERGEKIAGTEWKLSFLSVAFDCVLSLCLPQIHMLKP